MAARLALLPLYRVAYVDGEVVLELQSRYPVVLPMYHVRTAKLLQVEMHFLCRNILAVKRSPSRRYKRSQRKQSER